MLLKKKGFTLLEVILTIAIIGLLSVALVSLAPQVLTYSNSAQNIAEAQVVAKMTMDVLEAEIRNANLVDIQSALPSTLVQGKKYIAIESGKVYSKTLGYSAKSISPSVGYKNYTYSINFSAEKQQVLVAELSLFFNSSKIYTITSRIFINNLSGKTITGISSGSCLTYTVAPMVTFVVTPPAPTNSPSPLLVSSIVVSSSSNSITVDAQTMQMSAAVSPSNAANKGVSWSVNDSSIATITNTGLLVPLKNASVTVTATAMDGSGTKGTKTIIISNQAIKVSDITLSTSTGFNNMGRYSSMRIYATITPGDAANKTVTWSVDNTDYATITSDGVLTSKDFRNVYVVVTAKSNDGSNVTKTLEILIRGT